MAFIEIVRHDKAEGELKQAYDDLLKTRGKLAEVHQIQSLNPEALVKHMDMYMSIMYSQSPLKRWQREMIAVAVSNANNCEYCVAHHAAALNAYWKDDSKLEQFINDHNSVGLEEKDISLCEYAVALTKDPSAIKEEEQITKMKNNDLDDRSILDCAQVVAYFNFVNRLVLGLGVSLEEHAGQGFKY